MNFNSPIARILGVAALLSADAAAQTVDRYDMGSATSPVAPGFTAVTAQSAYSAAQGYGWLPGATLNELVRPEPHPHVAHTLSKDLLRDSVAASSTFSFRRDLPAGEYGCVVVLGDLGDPGAATPSLTPLGGLNVRANGVTVAANLIARTGQGKATFDNAWGGYKRISFTCQPDSAGQLTLEFSSSGGGLSSVMSIEIYPRLRPPISFSHTTNTLVAAPLYQTVMTNFLGHFNAHRYIRARLELDAIPSSPFNDLGKAWGYAWLAGWLTDAEQDVDPTLLTTIDTLLAGLDPNDFRVAILRHDRDHFAKGELFLRTRGYSLAAFPENQESTGELLWNLCAGAQLMEQLDDDILLPTALGYRPDSPFFPKAQYLLARSMYGRNVQLFLNNDVYSFVEFNTQIISILNALWTRLDPAVSGAARLFPKAADATVLAYFVRTHLSGPSGPLTKWIDTPLPHPVPPVDYNSTWFKNLTEFTTTLTPPNWALHQWRYARLARTLSAWWADKRLKGKELGGGTGDDVEGAGGLSVQSIVKTEGAGHALEKALHSVLDGALFGPEVDASQGFYFNPDLQFATPPGGVMDSAHAGEYTSYPLAVLLPANNGNPRYFEFAMRTVRNMIEPLHPLWGDTAWTGIPGSPSSPGWTNWRHFKAFRLGAYSYEQPVPGGPNVDMDSADNMRVIAPGFFLIDHSGITRAKELWYEYGRAWAAAAMHDGTGYAAPKPVGIFPVGIDYQDGMFGENNEWWSNSQQNSGGIGGHSFDLYYLLLTAFRTSSEPYAARIKLIEPIGEAVRFLSITNPSGQADPGTDKWTAAQTATAIARIAFMARRELIADLGLFPSQVDAVIDSYGPPMLAYLNAPPPPTGGKDKTAIAAQFEQDAIWLQRYWPLATTVVSYTDRLPIDAGGSNFALFQAMGGAHPIAAPTNPVSWSLPPTAPQPSLYQQSLETAILLNELHSDAGAAQPLALKALLYHFGDTATPIDLRVWRGLPHGQYRVDIGPDTDEDDQLNSVTTSFAVELDGRDDVISLPSIPRGQLTVVDLVWTGPPSSSVVPQLDLGLSPEDIADFIGATQITVHNLSNANFAATPGALVELYDDATGLLLASAPLPSIPAPVDLNPSSASVVVAHSIQLNQRLRAELKFPASVTQISLSNDRAVAQF